ncbi:hypothetical protein MA16_Dca013178 [Dendrobium catenatum]|uniref:Uncharacterized protein n=1 Tax=Dendrobium catenatum TaxID=906689 RepID=A0A2I0WR19_9ASPA|nr:hypothetical protein MA16_Dca013178 [Dendrobium catenatum]
MPEERGEKASSRTYANLDERLWPGCESGPNAGGFSYKRLERRLRCVSSVIEIHFDLRRNEEDEQMPKEEQFQAQTSLRIELPNGV